jgi:hypothetical protein
MLNEDEVAALESLIRRMSDKQRSGLEAWISSRYPYPSSAGTEWVWVPDSPLWEAIKEAQECMHLYEVPPSEPCPWDTPQEPSEPCPWDTPQGTRRKSGGHT